MQKLVERLKALGEENRFKIFLLLVNNQICVKGLSNTLNISESAVSQHLKVLKNADLIIGERVGYFTHYNVNAEVLKELEGVIGALVNGADRLEDTKKDLGINAFDCTQVCKNQSRKCGES